jgi:hypothetical protein
VIGIVAAFFLLSCGCVASFPVLWLYGRLASVPPQTTDEDLFGATDRVPMTTPWKGTAAAPATKLAEPDPDPLKPALPDGVIAASGFNDAKGLLSDPYPTKPFFLGFSDQTGGDSEPGWTGPWPKDPAATFQSKIVHEGDGALYLTGAANVGPNYRRQLAQVQTGAFEVEHQVLVPVGSSLAGYVWRDLDGGAEKSGPNWGVRDGKFYVCDGDGKGSVETVDTGWACQPNTWHKVTLRINVADGTWEFLVDDRGLARPRPLRFRARVEYLDTINFLAEGGIYIDAVQVKR